MSGDNPVTVVDLVQNDTELNESPERLHTQTEIFDEQET